MIFQAKLLVSADGMDRSALHKRRFADLVLEFEAYLKEDNPDLELIVLTGLTQYRVGYKVRENDLRVEPTDFRLSGEVVQAFVDSSDAPVYGDLYETWLLAKGFRENKKAPGWWVLPLT
jgi:hypothetical protein